MARFIIQGGNRIAGTLTPIGNKNAALPMVAACLLTGEPVTLNNVPAIRDVDILIEILATLGATVEKSGSSVTITAADIDASRLPEGLSRRVRGSVLLAGPLLSRCGEIALPPPGGDVIGKRRLDTHFHGLAALGATILTEDGVYKLSARQLTGTDILLDEASVTATENIIMAAVRAAGQTTIYHAACEPHVQNLCRMLVKMGAHIEGIGTNYLRIHGIAELTGCTVEIDPDFMEAGSYLAAAAATGGELRITGMQGSNATGIMQHGFRRLGVEWVQQSGDWFLSADQDLAIADDFGGAVTKLEDGPWPSFPSDLMSVAIVLATQAKGDILFFEKMFESRMYFVDRLIEMGARIVQCDPHRVMVLGPCPLRGQLLTSPDIRAGMALVIAALCAEGESIIENAQMIDRGYERIDERLRSLGADIVREDG